MQNTRLSLAFEAGLVLPEDGPIAVFRPQGDMLFDPLPRARVQAIQGFAPAYDALRARGIATQIAPEGRYSAAIVCLPRAKDEARSLIATAMSVAAGGIVVIDGAKTDGVESVLRDMRKRTDVAGPVSKAHGKVFWCRASDAFADWAAVPGPNADGFITAPGVFSADKVDRASAALVAALPENLGRNIADLGAGWGYLSSQIQSRAGYTSLHLVEAEASALDCARQNVTDPRAQFHWADVTRWQTPVLMEGVIMNPPFHTSRAAEPALGQAFIRAARGIMAPGGRLWLVANRHLPYETILSESFLELSEIAGDRSFKILQAARPRRL